MDKIPLIIIAVILAVALLFVWYSGASKTVPQGILLFYGDGCPHCKIVDDFISQNKIEEKVKFTRLEVWNNKRNANLIMEKALECKIDISNGVGVPFLYDGKQCYIGQDDVINFFKNEAGIK